MYWTNVLFFLSFMKGWNIYEFEQILLTYRKSGYFPQLLQPNACWRQVNFYAPSLKGLPGASSNRIARPFVHNSILLTYKG